MALTHVESHEEPEASNVAIAYPDEQTFLVRSLLNFDAPHYFAKFTIKGCPVGLEILNKYEHLVVNRRLRCYMDETSDKRLLAYSQYDIKNSRGVQLYLALENVTNSSLKWVRDARLFEVSFFDFHCRKVISVKRKSDLRYLFAQYCCLLFTYGFMGWGNAVDVYLPDGSTLGSINQSLSLTSTILNIYNNSGKHILVIQGVASDGILDVRIPNEDEPIAMIETLMTDSEAFIFYRVSVPHFSSPYGITFFRSFIPPEHKALLLSSIILLDFMLLSKISDYPHMAEMIPSNYEETSMPNFRLHRDGSKELLIFSEQISAHRPRKSRKWRKCVWFYKLSCACFRLGVRRNAVRCICLTILVCLALIIIFVTLMVYNKE